MPQDIFQKYQLTGWKTVSIYSEAEMAQALGISREQLRQEIKAGRLCYHAHPSSNALREYQFNAEAYRDNVAWWQCLQSGGHAFQHERWLAPGRQVRRCAKCGRMDYD